MCTCLHDPLNMVPGRALIVLGANLTCQPLGARTKLPADTKKPESGCTLGAGQPGEAGHTPGRQVPLAREPPHGRRGPGGLLQRVPGQPGQWGPGQAGRLRNPGQPPDLGQAVGLPLQTSGAGAGSALGSAPERGEPRAGGCGAQGAPAGWQDAGGGSAAEGACGRGGC